MFNTLKYARMLEEVGFSREEAEITIKVLDDVMEDKLVTKEIFENRVQTLEAKIEHSIAMVKSDLTIRIGGMIGASIAILTAIQKLTH